MLCLCGSQCSGWYTSGMRTVHDIPEITSAVARAAHPHDIQRVYLFGSYARGEAKEDSDVDLCIEAGQRFSLFSAGSFLESVKEALGVDVDVVSERSMYEHARRGMLDDRVLVYERV